MPQTTTQQVEYVNDSNDIIKMALKYMEEGEAAAMEMQRELNALKALVVGFVQSADRVKAARTEPERGMACSLLVEQVLAAGIDLDVEGPEEKRVCSTCDGARRIVFESHQEIRCPDCAVEG